jgi:glycosyltransferase involved in cell wall biosynthesis
VKLLLLSQWFHPEPGALRALPLARVLQAQGDQVRVLTGFPNYPGGQLYPGYRMRPHTRECIDGVETHRVALYPSHSASAAGRMANYLSFALTSSLWGVPLARWADVIYLVHPPPAALGPVAFGGLWRRCPLVLNIPDLWPDSVAWSGMADQGWKGGMIHALDWWCRVVYRRSAAITVLSPGFRRLLVERGVPEEKVHVIYNWTEEDLYRPLPRDPRLAVELGMAGDHVHFMYAGNLGALQGLETLLYAAQRLQHLPGLRLVLIGTGQREAALRQLAEELQLRNVLFLARRPATEMPAIQALADVLVVHLRDLPMFNATIPSKTQVALASGKPLVMAVRGDSADLVAAAGAGVTCEPENPAALACAMERLYHLSAAEREDMGRRGRQYYLDHMSLELGAAATRRVLMAASTQGARPGDGL